MRQAPFGPPVRPAIHESQQLTYKVPILETSAALCGPGMPTVCTTCVAYRSLGWSGTSVGGTRQDEDQD